MQIQGPREDKPTGRIGEKPNVRPTDDALLEKMAGQMIIVGFRGAAVDGSSVKAVIESIRKGELGGVMYLEPNIKSLAAVSAMNNAFVEARPEPDLPPFISLDQEGGSVQRLKRGLGVKYTPSAARVARDFTPEAAHSLYVRLAKMLAITGFNVNFGPVVDLNVNPNNPIIGRYGRSFGKDVGTVDKFAGAFISAHHEAGVLTALKHFPGHGSSASDSHKGSVDITGTWTPVELGPYHDLIRDNVVDFIMVGHLYDNYYRDERESGLLPASLSPFWIEKILRKELSFNGVVISDDLEMGAIRKEFPTRETVVRAVKAGVDVLLFSNTAKYDPLLADRIRADLVDEANADPEFAKRIEQSYARIKKLKTRLAEWRGRAANVP